MTRMDTSIIAALLVIFFWGLWGFFFKIGIDKIGVDRATFWAFVGFFISDIFILAYFFFAKKTAIAATSGMPYMLAGAILSALGTIAFIFYIRKVGVSVAVPMSALYPAVTTVLAILVLKEKIKLTSAAGILLAIAAGVLLAL